jgi:hypothetical protein
MNVSQTYDVNPLFDQIIDNAGFEPVNAICELSVDHTNFSRLFYIKTDDVDTLDVEDPNNNMSYGIIGSADVNVANGYNPFQNISYSFAKLLAGFANPATTYVNNTSIYQDYVRYTAKTITGGYALSDIFDNENELMNGVITLDTSFNEAFYSLLDNASICETNESNISDSNFSSYLISCKSLVGNLLKDSVNANTSNTSSYARGQRFLTDLAEQSAEKSAELNLSDPNTSGFEDNAYWVIFHPGDVLAVRLTYLPKDGAGTPAKDLDGNNLGQNNLENRSYKVYLRMT